MKMLFRLVRTCVCGLALIGAAQAQETANAGYRQFSFEHTESDAKPRTTAVFLWYPTTQAAESHDYGRQTGFVAENSVIAPGRHALIVFSHGYRGVGTQTIFLMEALARSGYIVAAPNHGDAMTVRSGPPERPGFADAASWTDSKFGDRKADIEHLLDHLLALDAQAGSFLNEHIDNGAIGGAGHSLGGYTMLGLAGAWKSWKDERIRAVLLLSPYAQPFLTGGNLAQVHLPVMLQGGTRDFGITPFLTPAYARLSAPKYFLTLEGATHFEWTNFLSMKQTTTECVKSGNAKLITDYAIAFFDRHLRGKTGESVLDASVSGLANYEYTK